jgi:hypothetical protein
MLRLLRTAAILAVVFNGSSAPEAGIGQEATGQFLAGVARKDGVIIPIGIYKSGSWSKIGPETCSDKPVPSNTAEILGSLGGIKRIPPAWFLWTEEGEQPLVMKVTKPVTVQSHCCQQWGLATGPNTAFSADSFPFPKLGLALSKPFKVELMRRLDPAEAEATQLLTLIRPHFDLIEDAALRAKQDHIGGLEQREVLNAFYGADIRSPRQSIPLKLQSSFRSRNPVNGQTVFHVQVFKEYAAASCPLVASSPFWISRDPAGTFTVLNQKEASVGFVPCGGRDGLLHSSRNRGCR